MPEFSILCDVSISGRIELKPSRLSIFRSLSSPAASFSGIMPVKRWPNEISRAVILLDGEPVLEAFPDIQTVKLSEEGLSLEISARSKGGRLLDNEAWPHTCRNYTTKLMFSELIESYDFTLDSPENGSLSEFTIGKGLSVWDAFGSFTRRVHGVLPWVNSAGIITLSPPRGEDPLTLGEKSHPIAVLSQTVDRYQAISQIYLRNEEGEYNSVVTNHDATDSDIRRVRFIIPAGEFTAAPFWDARQRIERSMREYLTVKATVPGFLNIRPGQGVIISHPRLFRPGLLADEVKFILDEKGGRTELTLKLAAYYGG